MTDISDATIVSKCDVGPCAYNREKQCHARGITVGGMQEHRCESVLYAAHHTASMSHAKVGACKAVGCVYNAEYQCAAPTIEVGFYLGQPHCLTHAAKSAEARAS